MSVLLIIALVILGLYLYYRIGMLISWLTHQFYMRHNGSSPMENWNDDFGGPGVLFNTLLWPIFILPHAVAVGYFLWTNHYSGQSMYSKLQARDKELQKTRKGY